MFFPFRAHYFLEPCSNPRLDPIFQYYPLAAIATEEVGTNSGTGEPMGLPKEWMSINPPPPSPPRKYVLHLPLIDIIHSLGLLFHAYLPPSRLD
jgi:hypothetical protein